MAKPSTSQVERLINAVNDLASAITRATMIAQGDTGLPIDPVARANLAARERRAMDPPPIEPPAIVPPKPVSGIRYEELAAAVLKVAEVKGQTAAVAILKSFGATHAKQLPEDKYAEALGAFEAALVAPAALA